MKSVRLARRERREGLLGPTPPAADEVDGQHRSRAFGGPSRKQTRKQHCGRELERSAREGEMS